DATQTVVSIQNALPPTIRAFRVLPYTAIDAVSEEDLDTIGPPSIRPPIIGQTIAPRSSVNLSASAYLDDIVQLKEQAFALGWIDNSSTTTSLDETVQAAKQA